MTVWATLFRLISCCRQHKQAALITMAIVMCSAIGGLVYSVARTPGATTTPSPPSPQLNNQLLAAHSNNVIRQTSLLLQFSSTKSLMIGGISLGVLAVALGVVALTTILCSKRHTSRDPSTPAASSAPTPQPVPLTTPHLPPGLPPGQLWVPSISALERGQ